MQIKFGKTYAKTRSISMACRKLYQKSEHNLTETILKYICNKYANKETMKITNWPGMYKTIYLNGS